MGDVRVTVACQRSTGQVPMPQVPCLRSPLVRSGSGNHPVLPGSRGRARCSTGEGSGIGAFAIQAEAAAAALDAEVQALHRGRRWKSLERQVLNVRPADGVPVSWSTPADRCRCRKSRLLLKAALVLPIPLSGNGEEGSPAGLPSFRVITCGDGGEPPARSMSCSTAVLLSHLWPAPRRGALP